MQAKSEVFHDLDVGKVRSVSRFCRQSGMIDVNTILKLIDMSNTTITIDSVRVIQRLFLVQFMTVLQVRDLYKY